MGCRSLVSGCLWVLSLVLGSWLSNVVDGVVGGLGILMLVCWV